MAKRKRCDYPMSEFYTYEDEVPANERVSTPEDCEGCDGLENADGENTCEAVKHCLITENDAYQCSGCHKVWSSNDFDGCVECGSELNKIVPVGRERNGEIIWGVENA